MAGMNEALLEYEGWDAVARLPPPNTHNPRSRPALGYSSFRSTAAPPPNPGPRYRYRRGESASKQQQPAGHGWRGRKGPP